MSPDANASAVSRDENDPSVKTLAPDQSRIFRELLALASAAATNNLLESVRSQVGNGPSRVELSNADFARLVSLLDPQVTALTNPDDQGIARAFLDDWKRPCRDGGTKIIITQ